MHNNGGHEQDYYGKLSNIKESGGILMRELSRLLTLGVIALPCITTKSWLIKFTKLRAISQEMIKIAYRIYRLIIHDDVIKWNHFPRNWSFVRGIHRSPGNSPHKGQWRGVLMFSLICARINGWVNNGEADDLRRHRAHYDVSVMSVRSCSIHLRAISQEMLLTSIISMRKLLIQDYRGISWVPMSSSDTYDCNE